MGINRERPVLINSHVFGSPDATIRPCRFDRGITLNFVLALFPWNRWTGRIKPLVYCFSWRPCRYRVVLVVCARCCFGNVNA